MKINKERDRTRIKSFTIPQKDFNVKGLRDGRNNFRPSTAATPFFGTDVRDEVVVEDISKKIDLDVRKNYDFVRENKKISEQEMIEEYGTAYPEFRTITAEDRKRTYGSDITINNHREQTVKKEEKKDSNISFDFIKSADEVIDEKKNNDELENFNFDQFKTETYKEENNNNEEEEFDLSFGSFKPRYNTPKEDNSHSTIVRGKVSGYKEKVIEEEKKEDVMTYEDLTRDHSGLPTPKEREVNQIYDLNGPAKSFEHTPNYKEGQAPSMTAHKDFSNFELPKIVDPYKDYKLPPRTIFKTGPASSKELPEWIFEKKDIIDETLKAFGIEGHVTNMTKGPAFSRFEISVELGVPIKKITTIYQDLQMALGVKKLRILAPIPGKHSAGIEVPNDKTDTVYFGDILNDEFYDNKPLKVALGKDIDNNSIYTRIDKWPHGLIAGSTGSGKSVCMNTMLISLLLKNKPDDLKLILVDPKTVELASYNDIPHLITPVINDPELASEALKWSCEEMDRRYKLFAENRSRNIEDYNEKCKSNTNLSKMCYIVIVVDELADLMQVASSDIEGSIQRITQKARAAGIHLLLATQRPTVDVVKGTIKANIPARVAFRTNSGVDSNTILDEYGAETLLGMGDMLLKDGGEEVKRLQGAWIQDEEIDAVLNFIRDEAEPDYLFSHDDLKKRVASTQGGSPTSCQESKEVLYQVALYCVEQKTCSINGILQEFNFGFNRAQRIVAALESLGIVSGKNGTKGREVLCDVSELEKIFNSEDSES